jgi:hypothetical protein
MSPHESRMRGNGPPERGGEVLYLALWRLRFPPRGT